MGLPVLLKQPKILLIGAGNVALQKASVLFANKIDFFVISLEFLDEMFKYTNNFSVKNFEISDIEGYDYVIDGTGNQEVASKLLEEKKKRFFLLNIVDVPEHCDFYFQALVNIGKLQISVSSNGASPLVAQKVRDKIKNIIPNELEEILDEAASNRAMGIINKEEIKEKANNILCKAYVIGCGTGDVELLTIRAYKAIQNLEVALIDALISDEIKAIIPKNCEIVDVGKRKDFHKKNQDEINEIFHSYLKQGKNVGRLKSGDPYLYGRGAEEVVYLKDRGINSIEVIPGVTSALSGCTASGIPVTHRDMAKSFSVVTAHLKGNSINLDWVDLLKKEQHTTVVLMGVSRVGEIKKAAIEIGCDMNLPFAIISNATRKNQKVYNGILEDIDKIAPKDRQPSIIVFGEVANFSEVLPHFIPTKIETI